MTAVPWPLLCLSRSLTGQCPRLERFPAKWTRFASRKRVKITNLEPRFDSIETEKALVVTRNRFDPVGLLQELDRFGVERDLERLHRIVEMRHLGCPDDR